MRKEYYKHIDGFGAPMCRISKNQARKLFYDGYEIVIAPCKANMLFLGWSYWHTYRNNDNLNKTSHEFDNIVNTHEYYNCSSRLGTYSKFFVSENTYKRIYGKQYND